jgi:hypothetical protein
VTQPCPASRPHELRFQRPVQLGPIRAARSTHAYPKLCRSCRGDGGFPSGLPVGTAAASRLCGRPAGSYDRGVDGEEDRRTELDQREKLADERDAAANQHEIDLEERATLAELRDAEAERRRAAANERDRLADLREEAAEQRDAHAEEREHLADLRDKAADERERAADERERAADMRDRDADRREAAIDEREIAAELDREWGPSAR